MKNKDKIFRIDKIKTDFQFDREVAQIFDDMLNRSIPFYREVIEATGEILNSYLGKNTLLYIANVLKEKNPALIGIDNSKDMIEKAKEKAKAYGKEINFAVSDIEKADISEADAVVMNYTLQFIRPIKRPEIVKKVFDGLKSEGIFILSEKIVFEHPKLNRDFLEIYYNFKKKQGYSELEIARKREALENVLIPFTLEENLSLLKKAGFSYTTPFFQWINFASIIAVK